MQQPNSTCSTQSKCRKLNANACNHRCTCRMDCSAVKPARDPLAALEAARRAVVEQEELERWDGLS